MAKWPHPLGPSEQAPDDQSRDVVVRFATDRSKVQRLVAGDQVIHNPKPVQPLTLKPGVKMLTVDYDGNPPVLQLDATSDPSSAAAEAENSSTTSLFDRRRQLILNQRLPTTIQQICLYFCELDRATHADTIPH